MISKTLTKGVFKAFATKAPAATQAKAPETKAPATE